MRPWLSCPQAVDNPPGMSPAWRTVRFRRQRPRAARTLRTTRRAQEAIAMYVPTTVVRAARSVLPVTASGLVLLLAAAALPDLAGLGLLAVRDHERAAGALRGRRRPGVPGSHREPSPYRRRGRHPGGGDHAGLPGGLGPTRGAAARPARQSRLGPLRLGHRRGRGSAWPGPGPARGAGRSRRGGRRPVPRQRDLSGRARQQHGIAHAVVPAVEPRGRLPRTVLAGA